MTSHDNASPAFRFPNVKFLLILVDDENGKSFGNLVFKDQYLEISTTLPSSALLYGMEENSWPTFSLYHNKSYTLRNVDIFSANTFVDLYGSQPFYMDIRRGGSANGVLLLNSNGMDIEYGGVLDFYFFAGPSPLSLMFNTTQTSSVSLRQCHTGLSIEMRQFVEQIHANGQKYVLIVDPGIGLNETYKTFRRGKQDDIFVKHGGVPYFGQFVAMPIHQMERPPYKINAAGIHRPLGKRTVPAGAVHYNDILEYNAHNLYGPSEVIVTNKALNSALKKRPFVLGGSTFVGSGAHAAHWTGYNSAHWTDLTYTIPTILNFGLFRVPMVGADICGFRLNTTEELCNRWIQLGSFYPFARDHSDIGTIDQELYLWKSVAKSARKALGLTYHLLPHIYTLSFETHSNSKTSVFHIPRRPIYTANQLPISAGERDFSVPCFKARSNDCS
eukprot:Gb_24066 [translate_table: standard]